MPNNIRLRINKEEFKKKLGLKQPVVDYARIQREVREYIESTRPRDAKDGIDGTNGKDGSPDTGAEIVSKINKLGLNGPKINASQIDGLTVFIGGGGSTSSGGASLAIGSTVTSGTANRVLYVDSTGALANSANLTFSGTVLTAANATITTALINTALTSGRVPFMTTSGQFTDSSSFTYNGTTVSATGLTATSDVTAGTRLITALVINTQGGSGVTITGSITTGSSNYNLKVNGQTRTGTTNADNMAIESTYNQTSTAGSKDLTITRTETGIGSGAHYFIYAQVTSTVKFSVTNAGAITSAALTTGRIPYSSTGGLITDSADLAFDGTSFVFNESGSNKDARFEGDTDANLFFTDASTDRVGVSTNTPLAKFHLANADEGVSGFLITKANRYTTAGDVFRIQDDLNRNGVIFGVNNDGGYFKTQYVTGSAYIASSTESGSPYLSFLRPSTSNDMYISFFTTGGGGDWLYGFGGADLTKNLTLSNNSGKIQTWTTTGTIGMGTVTSPTAIVHIQAGTATASTAPLKFNSGTLNTTAEAGAVEYNGNHYKTGASAVRFSVGGTIFDHYADAGNGTTVETDLYSDTLAANTFNVNGDKIEAQYGGIFVSSATATRQVKVKFAGTTILDTGALSISASSSWGVYILLQRVSSTVVRYTVNLQTAGASTAVYNATGELTGLTLSGTNILKLTGQAAGVGAATNDIVAKLGYICFGPAV